MACKLTVLGFAVPDVRSCRTWYYYTSKHCLLTWYTTAPSSLHPSHPSPRYQRFAVPVGLQIATQRTVNFSHEVLAVNDVAVHAIP